MRCRSVFVVEGLCVEWVSPTKKVVNYYVKLLAIDAEV